MSRLLATQFAGLLPARRWSPDGSRA